MGVQSFFFFEARRTFMFETGSLERTLFYGILLNKISNCNYFNFLF